MKTNLLFASAAVAAVLVMTAPAHAQLLGAGARGGAGGALAGSFGGAGGVGGEGGMTDMNGRMSAASDASLRGGFPRRGVDRSARTAATAGARATGAANTAAHAGVEKGETLAREGVGPLRAPRARPADRPQARSREGAGSAPAARQALPVMTRQALPVMTRQALPAMTRQALPAMTRQALPVTVSRRATPARGATTAMPHL